jgi:methylmalonyl-CoA/ethylmalonyl-CoA epimerase
MKLARLNHIGVATPSIAASIVFCRDVMGTCIAKAKHYNDLIM